MAPTSPPPGRSRRGRPDVHPALLTPGGSPVRHEIERRSASFLMLLHQGPRWVLPVVMAALLLAGFAAPGWLGAAALCALAAALAWLAYLSWPALPIPARLVRFAAIAALALAAAGRGAGML